VRLFSLSILSLISIVTLGLSSVSFAWDDHRDPHRAEEDMRRREEDRRRWVMEHQMHHEVIAPAAVVYAPPIPSPGISIVLPINIH
jgi:hypothetical protein